MKKVKPVFEQPSVTLSDGADEYLGAERERIEGVLTAKQIYKKQGKAEVEKWISIVREGEMRLNSDLDYTYLIPYIQLAIQYQIPYAVVEKENLETNIGLVIAHACAVDKDSIWLKDEKNLRKDGPAITLKRQIKQLFAIKSEHT